MSNYQHILIATDFFKGSETITDRAIRIAENQGARISIIHVIEPIYTDWTNELVVPENFDVEQQLRDSAEENLEKFAQEHQLEFMHKTVEIGGTRETIVRFAVEHSVDLIVIGSHGRHGLERLLGSTANSVLHHATCDVLAVRVSE